MQDTDDLTRNENTVRVPQLGAAATIDPRRARSAVFLIDTFTVPAAARAEFDAAAKRNRDFIHTLPGFRGDVVFACEQGGAFDVATIAAWESPEAFARAKEEVAAYYHRIGFDMPAAIARWGVTMRRAICTTPAKLPWEEIRPREALMKVKIIFTIVRSLFSVASG